MCGYDGASTFPKAVFMPLRSTLASLLTLRHKAEDAALGLPALMVEAENTARGLLSGAHARRKAGTGEKFWQFRDYDPADRPQDIDWRLSAKGDRVYVRQKEHQVPRPLVLAVETGPRMAYASRRNIPQKADAARILALGAALLATRAGEQVTLAGAGLRPGRSENTLEKIALGLLGEGLSNLIPHDSLPPGGYLMAIGDFLDPPETVCARIESSGVAPGNGLVLQVLDPAEIELPFEGRAVFQDPADGRRHAVMNVEGVREAYRQRIAAHIETLADLCRHRHWHFMLHRTDTPARETLHKIWLAIGPDMAARGGQNA